MKKIYQSTGKKKTSIAKVFLKKEIGGKIIVNKKSMKNYFPKKYPYKLILWPLTITKNERVFKIKIKVKGGGVMGQIMAIRQGISKALLKYNLKLKTILSKNKLITRDSRIVERKKLGKKKSRKSRQFSKR